jgi:hypothetical protein
MFASAIRNTIRKMVPTMFSVSAVTAIT